jgi:hypothetical protein
VLISLIRQVRATLIPLAAGKGPLATANRKKKLFHDIQIKQMNKSKPT